ncbi:MAG: metalloregulator ArsR/SmtB family transcription factor [Gemmatimonadaceae bacterium]
MNSSVVSPPLDRSVELFHALSDTTRLAIVAMLRDGERCVCDLQDELDAAQSRLSFHLKVLRDAGLVSDRKEGRWSYYQLVPEVLAEVHDAVVGMKPRDRELPVRSRSRCCG